MVLMTLYYHPLHHSNTITNIRSPLEKPGCYAQIKIILSNLYREKKYQTIAATRIQYKTTMVDTKGSIVMMDTHSIYHLEGGSIIVSGAEYNPTTKETEMKYSGIVNTQSIVSGTDKYDGTSGEVTILTEEKLPDRIVKINIHL